MARETLFQTFEQATDIRDVIGKQIEAEENEYPPLKNRDESTGDSHKEGNHAKRNSEDSLDQRGRYQSASFCRETRNSWFRNGPSKWATPRGSVKRHLSG